METYKWTESNVVYVDHEGWVEASPDHGLVSRLGGAARELLRLAEQVRGLEAEVAFRACAEEQAAAYIKEIEAKLAALEDENRRLRAAIESSKDFTTGE